MDLWTPVQDEMLILKREPTTVADRNAVAVLREDRVVGHTPFNLAPSISLFLKRDINKAFAQVVGEKVNRGAGYRLEICYVYNTLSHRRIVFVTPIPQPFTYELCFMHPHQ